MLKSVLLTALSTVPDSTIISQSESLVESTPSIDWIQLLLDLFVTFLGFGLAILGERITDRINAHRSAKELKILLKEELEKVFYDLKKYNEETLDVQPLKIPSWESAINIGQVSLLDFDTRNTLFRIYNSIKEFNSWCLVHTNYYFEKGKKNRLLITEIIRIKKELLSDLNDNNLSISYAIKILERRKK